MRIKASIFLVLALALFTLGACSDKSNTIEQSEKIFKENGYSVTIFETVNDSFKEAFGEDATKSIARYLFATKGEGDEEEYIFLFLCKDETSANDLMYKFDNLPEAYGQNMGYENEYAYFGTSSPCALYRGD